MSMFAVMSGTTVVNIIVTDNQQQAETDLGVTLVEYTDENPAVIGWSYDGETGKFISPAPSELHTFNKITWEWEIL